VESYSLSPDGGRLVYKAEKAWFLVEPKEGLKPGEGKLDFSGLAMELDAPAEWAQIFRETWRLYRDFFYVPDMGKIDWAGIRKRYEPLVAHVSHRIDLNYVLGEMAGELGSGMPTTAAATTRGRSGCPWGRSARLRGRPEERTLADRADLRGAELGRAAPVAADRAGRERHSGRLHSRDRRARPDGEGRALPPPRGLCRSDGRQERGRRRGRTATLLVNAAPTKAGAREVVVRPIASEESLRYYDWVESNRRKVDKATNGRIGYIHIPTWAPTGSRSSSGSTTRSSARRASSSTSGRTAAGSSRRSSSSV